MHTHRYILTVGTTYEYYIMSISKYRSRPRPLRLNAKVLKPRTKQLGNLLVSLDMRVNVTARKNDQLLPSELPYTEELLLREDLDVNKMLSRQITREKGKVRTSLNVTHPVVFTRRVLLSPAARLVVTKILVILLRGRREASTSCPESPRICLHNSSRRCHRHSANPTGVVE